MKAIICLSLVLLCSQVSWAYPCPDSVKTRSGKVIYSWLKKFAGKSRVQDCVVEIIACDPNDHGRAAGPIGEVMITQRNGSSGYMQLSWAGKNDPLIETEIDHWAKMFSYKKTDRHYEKVNGRLEFDQLEIVTNWLDTSKMQSITIGKYATNRTEGLPEGTLSRWWSCLPEDERHFVDD